MILNKLQRVWLSVVRLPHTAAFTEIEGYKVVAIQFQLFCVSLHAYGITRTLPPFVDFHLTCQHYVIHFRCDICCVFCCCCFVCFFLFFCLFVFSEGGGGGVGGAGVTTKKFPKRKTSISILFSSRYGIVYIWETDYWKMLRGITD